jgi:predicted transcriptional regulator
MLEALFGSAVKEKTLLYLFTHEQGYPREVAKALRVGLYAVQSQLDRLENAGVLVSRLRGRTRLFSISPRYPFRKELTALLAKALEFTGREEEERRYTPRLRPRRTGKPL